jgi:hypothetical protein
MMADNHSAKDCGKFEEKTDESGNYSIKYTTCFEFENIIDFIMTKKEIYERIFHETPNYIKMPMWVYRRMTVTTVSSEFSKYDNSLVCDLIICPTNSIQSITEIEVF